MNKICTSLEQSEKLVELGIDINTADMHWMNGILFLSFDKVDKAYCDKWGYDYLPAWSLSALMDILPIFRVPTAFSDKVSVPSMIKTDNGYLLKYVGDFEIKINNGGDIEAPIEVLADTTIDAAFEMVCWLKENNKI